MFGLSEATELLQGSTGRTLNCFLHYTQLIWSKITKFSKPIMPKSRKRHHSRSRSKSRSHSRDRSRDREDKHRKIESYEKDRDGKRRKLDSSDSPLHRRSVSCEPQFDLIKTSDEKMYTEELETTRTTTADDISFDSKISTPEKVIELIEDDKNDSVENPENDVCNTTNVECANERTSAQNEVTILNDSSASTKLEELTPSKVKKKLEITPKKVLSPKQLQKKQESEKKRKEKAEKEKKRNEEKELLKQEKMKKKEEKLKELEQRQKEKEQKLKEKELKEAQKREEREKKEEQKRKERNEKEQKRREKQEKDEEKNKEKLKEEEKKQKAAAAFVNFFVMKKTDNVQEKKHDESSPSLFMAFEIKSDMRLPPPRRIPLSSEELENLDLHLQKQSESANYLNELKNDKIIQTCSKTWPYQETLDDEDVILVEDDVNLGETICEDSKLQKFRTKFLKFHENRRPPYYGTWRKKSNFVTARRPFAEDNKTFNYEEDSDDDWEEEEQGESLNGSDDEDKENDEERDEYEVDNEFFVPHGHLSDDEIDDEENAKLSPESLKEKLKLLKDEFDQDMQSKTHRLKSRSIGCIWYNKDGSNIDEPIKKYLQPLAAIVHQPIHIKNRNELLIFGAVRKKPNRELQPEYIPLFLKVIQGNTNKKVVVVEQFLTFMANKGINVDLKKGTLIKILKRFAAWKPYKGKGNTKNKYCWLVNEEIEKEYNADLVLPNFLSDSQKQS